MTEERLDTRSSEMRLRVSEALANWTTFERSGQDLLKIIAAGLGCEAATFWLPECDALIPRLSWRESHPPGSSTGRDAPSVRLPKGVGLAGLVWGLRKPIDLARLKGGARDVRHKHDDGPELRTAVALPVMSGDEVMAVIEVTCPEKLTVTKRSLETLRAIGYEIGNLLASRRGRLAPNPLTPREIEILLLAADGLSTPQIASRLTLGRSTVRTHFDHIYAKLEVSDRAAAVAHALRHGLIE